MSEQITHIAFFDDIANLISHHPEINPLFAKSINAYPDHGIVATGSRGNHIHAVPLLEKAKDLDGENKMKHISVSLGWIMHRAIDLVTKPVSLDKHPDLLTDPRFSSDEGEIYHDAVTFKEVFGSGEAKPVFSALLLIPLLLSNDFSKDDLNKFIYTEKLEELLALGFTAENFGLNYKVSPPKTTEGSVEEFTSGYQEFSERLDTYVEAYHRPNAEKEALYLNHFNFYDLDDEIIQLTKDSRSDKIEGKALVQALEKAKDQSVYSKGLAKAFYMISNASLFFEGNISKDALHDAIENFHPPHRL